MVDVVTRMPQTPLDGLLEGGVADLSDQELIGAMAAARAIASRAQAIELTAVAELSRRRLAEDDVPAVEVISPRDYLTEEVAQALTLTSASAMAWSVSPRTSLSGCPARSLHWPPVTSTIPRRERSGTALAR